MLPPRASPLIVPNRSGDVRVGHPVGVTEQRNRKMSSTGLQSKQVKTKPRRISVKMPIN